MRKLLTALTPVAAVGIVAATMTAITPDCPAPALGATGSWQYVILPFIEQDNVYRQL